MRYEYSDFELLPVNRREYQIRKYTNFSIINDQYSGSKSSELVINQKAFLIPETFPPHFHTVRDMIGQFAIIKKVDPHVFMWLPAQTKDSYDEAVPPTYQFALNQCFGLIPETFIPLKEHSKVTFDAIYLIITNGHALLSEALGEVNVYDLGISAEEELQLHIDMYVEASEIMSPLKKVPKRTKKIYVSRRKEDLSFENYLRDFNEYLKHGMADVEMDGRAFLEHNLRQQMEIYEEGQEPYTHGMGVTFRYIAERMLTQNDHDLLETYYQSQGYEILDASALHFNEQIEVFSEASHVVGIAGGGMVNTLFCPRDTEITLLCPSNTFLTGGHSAPLDHIYPKLRVIPDRDCGRDYSAGELNVKYRAIELIAKDVLVRNSEDNGLSTPTSQLINDGVS